MNPGFYPASELPMAQYLSDPCPEPSLSSGIIWDLITESPAHAHANHPKYGALKSEDNDGTDMGQIAHALLLKGELKVCEIDPQMYRSKPTKDNPEGSVPAGWTNNAIREARDQARDNGLIPVLKGSIQSAYDMVHEAQKFLPQSELAGLLDGGEGEITQIWLEESRLSSDPLRQFWGRARHDWVNHEMRARVSYKTTKMSANPKTFIRTMVSMGYPEALAWYRRGFEAIVGVQEGWRDVILVQEQRAPYACSLISLDPGMWAIADQNVERAVRIWQNCVAWNRWPAYSPQIHYATPTPWQLAEAEAMGVGDE